MKIEERIEKMKKVYLATAVADQEVANGWQDLEVLLGPQQNASFMPIFVRTFAMLSIVLLLAGSLVAFAQTSKPGALLYPVKKLSDTAFVKLTKFAPVFVQEKVVLVEEKKKESSSAASFESSSSEDTKSGADQQKSKDVKGVAVEREQTKPQSEITATPAEQNKGASEKQTQGAGVHASDAVQNNSHGQNEGGQSDQHKEAEGKGKKGE